MKEDKKEKPDEKREVHVTVLYTSTAEDRNFVAASAIDAADFSAV